MARCAEFGGLPGEIHLHQDLRCGSCRQGRGLEPLQQVHGIHGLDTRERRRRLACLVRLQMADQVPPDRDVGRFLDLLQRLLHLVFPEVALAGGPGGPDVIGAEGLRDRNQRDLGRVTAGSAGSRGHPRPDGVEVLRDVLERQGGGAT